MGKVINPPGSAWIDVGGFIDDEGRRIAAIGFSQPDNDRVTVVFTPEFFAAFADHVGRVSEAMHGDGFWTDAAKLAEKDRRFGA